MQMVFLLEQQPKQQALKRVTHHGLRIQTKDNATGIQLTILSAMHEAEWKLFMHSMACVIMACICTITRILESYLLLENIVAYVLKWRGGGGGG